MGAPSQLTQAQVQALDKIASGAPVEQSVIDHPGGAFVREMPLRQNDVFLVVLNRL
jgi:xylan 1,4-beta-xylosidase